MCVIKDILLDLTWLTWSQRAHVDLLIVRFEQMIFLKTCKCTMSKIDSNDIILRRLNIQFRLWSVETCLIFYAEIVCIFASQICRKNFILLWPWSPIRSDGQSAGLTLLRSRLKSHLVILYEFQNFVPALHL
jgi:hypothetical protein